MKAKKQPEISWDISVPLITNPHLFRSSFKLWLMTWLIAIFFFGFIFLVKGDFDVVLPILKLMTMLIVGIWVIMLIVMLSYFGNRMPMRFTINHDGVTCEITSKRSKWANRALIVLGILARKPGAVGTGAIALSQESQTFEWKRIYSVVFNDKRNIITLRNRWRSLIMIFCLPENYGKIVEIIKSHIPRRPENIKTQKNPMIRLLSRTALTTLACVPLFRLDYPFKIDLFLPIFILCFALATIWLIPLLGYVVMVAVLYVTIVILSQGFKVHSSSFSIHEKHRGFEFVHGDEWVFMALLGLAMFYLVWSSWRAVKGKDESALFLD
jgi:hypothetical protein